MLITNTAQTDYVDWELVSISCKSSKVILFVFSVHLLWQECQGKVYPNNYICDLDGIHQILTSFLKFSDRS